MSGPVQLLYQVSVNLPAPLGGLTEGIQGGLIYTDDSDGEDRYGLFLVHAVAELGIPYVKSSVVRQKKDAYPQKERNA